MPEEYDTDLLSSEVEEELTVTIPFIIDKLMMLSDELSGLPLRSYQVPIARRILESLVIGDGKTITALQCRQSGKSQVVSNTIAVAMVMLPILAKVFPDLLKKFERGVWVGCFGPTDDQAEIVYSRIVSILTSERALEFFADPDINEKITKGFGNTMHLRSGSLIRRQTAHPRSNIEGKTYHLVLIDECQDVEARVVNKSIRPMLASTHGSAIFIGTPGYVKGVFYNTIQSNKRDQVGRAKRQNHFEIHWKDVAKVSKDYGYHVKDMMREIGEDSDEFRMAYCNVWMLDKGMFTTGERVKALSDSSMEIVHAWAKTPVVVGIDPARKQDSTIVTVVWVDWDRPDEFGVYDQRILNWLDLTGMDWEAQYPAIVDFLANYRVLAIGIDGGGVGDVVMARLQVLMPNIPIYPMMSDRATQSTRWKNLKTLLERGKISWPGHAFTRRLKVWKRFAQQMEDLEIKYDGPYVIAAAPKAADAHDDYCDSLAIACAVPLEYNEWAAEVEQAVNPFYSGR